MAGGVLASYGLKDRTQILTIAEEETVGGFQVPGRLQVFVDCVRDGVVGLTGRVAGALAVCFMAMFAGWDSMFLHLSGLSRARWETGGCRRLVLALVLALVHVLLFLMLIFSGVWMVAGGFGEGRNYQPLWSERLLGAGSVGAFLAGRWVAKGHRKAWKMLLKYGRAGQSLPPWLGISTLSLWCGGNPGKCFCLREHLANVQTIS